MADRGVARIAGHVVTRRADLAHLLVADLHDAGLRPPRRAGVPGACARDCDDLCMAGCAVVRGDRRSALEDLTIRVDAWWALEDDMTTWQPMHVAPPIVWPGHPEA